MEDETSLLMVRQTFADRSIEEPAELKITNLSGQDRPRSPYHPAGG